MAVIEVANLTKKFGNNTAVNDISFNIEKGEIVGFVGKNGAGKSTTIRCMLGMIKQTDGNIKINGLDALNNSKKIKHDISYVPSECAFYNNITSRDLFRLCLNINGNEQYVSGKDVFDKAQELSEYFELDINRKINDLSLGNKKKVSVIAALLKHTASDYNGRENSSIIILDEPTSGLDPLMQEKFFKVMLREKEKGTTIFLSSHNLNEVEKYCDKVIIIKEGKIADCFDMKKVLMRHKQLVEYMTTDGKHESFESEGDINEIVLRLSKIKLKALEIKNVSIEDEFIKFYKEDNQNEII